MAELVRAAAALLAAMGLVAALTALLFGGGPRNAMAVLLDFLVAAGLLRLSLVQAWTAIAVAALTMAIRKVVVAGLSRRPLWRPDRAPLR
ncbi:hypothetical protein ACQPYK_08155 [Streptosporangium sp. CA-135522]|uniref:hypothetical protein n=1 Tax=Streptosporangium sp. CA-135522 TaxID=3240072 RepID=UPI003D944F42